jgi:hypothetical protein
MVINSHSVQRYQHDHKIKMAILRSFRLVPMFSGNTPIKETAQSNVNKG